MLEQRVEEWENGHAVVQMVTPEDSDENQLRFCYYKDGEFVNRPLTVSLSQDAAERTGEIVETIASLARTFTADEIEALVEELGEEKILELSILIDELGKSHFKEILKEDVDEIRAAALRQRIPHNKVEVQRYDPPRKYWGLSNEAVITYPDDR